MQILEPYEVHTHVGDDSRDTRALLTSLVAHALVILAVLLRPMASENIAPPPQAETGQPVALDPRVAFQEPQRADAPPPPPSQPLPEEPVLLGPDSDRPEDPPREQGPEEPPPELENPPNLPTNDPLPERNPQDTEEATRIPTPADVAASGRILGSPTSPFPGVATGAEGPPPQGAAEAGAAVGAMGRTGISNSDSRGWRQSFPQASGQCVQIPDLGTNADGTPVLASVIGVVLDQRGRPLAGAHLQILGAPFATFSDGSGRYRLEFDPKLLEKCRTQVVRVVATGYREQTLNLGIGRQVTSDDVVLRRR